MDLLGHQAEAFPQARIDIKDAIAIAIMKSKYYYDKKHRPMFFRPGDKVLLRLYKGYSIPSAKSRKLSQQYIGPFEVLERVGRLAYRLELPAYWRVYPVFSVAMLEPVPAEEDPWKRPRPDQPSSVYVDGDTDTNKSYELEKIVDKRVISRGLVRYLVRWKGYGPQEDVWKTPFQLQNAKELIQDYETAVAATRTIATRNG